MKTKEELNALKEEVETLNKKLAELNEEELEQVNGGGVDWQHFSDKFLDAFVSGKIQPTAANKELVEAIKAKDWMGVAIKATPLAATDPVIAMIFYECRT